jgi:multimeric flavodoxin WrbA
MQQQKKQVTLIRLCTSCFNCKKKDNKVYCKLGVWEEPDDGSTILHTPFDFNCPRWDEA